jgi:ribonuclease P protein component
MQTPHLDVRFDASASVHPRVGLIVPKHKQSAVDRNRLRRRLRELIRIELLPTLRRGDTLIRTKSEAYGVTFPVLKAEVETIGVWISDLSLR